MCEEGAGIGEWGEGWTVWTRGRMDLGTFAIVRVYMCAFFNLEASATAESGGRRPFLVGGPRLMVIARSFVASDLLKRGSDRQQEARLGQ